MRRILSGAIVFLGLLAAASLGTASAADLGVKAPPTPAPWVCPFCGFYAGLNAGFGITSGDPVNTGTDTGGSGLGSALAVGSIPTTINDNAQGFVGGGQIGYNWQVVRDWVTGIEADFDGMSAKHTVTTAPAVVCPIGCAPFSTSFDREVDWFGTLRLKGGFSVMNNALFVYGTTGGAIAQFGLSNQFVCAGCTPAASTEASTTNSSKFTRVGGVIGTGLEWMVVPKVSIKAELLYLEVGSSQSTITYNYGGNTSTLTTTTRNGLTVFRGGLNWYF